ncbi:MAG: exodeoxyribonuclease V subunit beta, partial [Methylococcales bacterium]|nr:exodeoxyribonuclease V subunit beta [Methylococcales bacterium]
QYQQLRTLWQSDHNVIEDQLVSDPGLNRRSFRKDYIDKWVVQCAQYFQEEALNVSAPPGLKKLTNTTIQTATKAKQTPPEHAFYTLNQTFISLLEKLDHFIIYHCLQQTKSTLAERKQQAGVLSFNDLLVKLGEALSFSPKLAEQVRKQYPVAMIDEFQDTDPIQYHIFKTIYPAEDDSGKTGLFMIGDPKQAIYSFRGADVFTYIKARRTTPDHAQYTLETNWRSTTAMVNAVNAVFEQAEQPFIYEQDIQFHPVKAADTTTEPAILIDGIASKALHIIQFKTNASNEYDCGYLNPATQKKVKHKAIRRNWASDNSAEFVANEIARLLTLSQQGKATVRGKPIEPKHFAILVKNRFQAYYLQTALRLKNISTVYFSRDSVLSTQDAADLYLILYAVAHYQREPAIRTALCTRLIGFSAAQLESTIQDDQQWEAWLEKFQHFYEHWMQKSFMSMFRTLLHELDIPKQLLATTDGQRHMTNLLQLGELLQAQSQQQEHPEKLLQWLYSHTQYEADEDENQQLRLESDDDLVKIVTIHKSKGLEYDIVFLPYLWDSKPLKKGEAFTFHDPDSNDLYLDLGSEQQQAHYAYADVERLSEEIRLLYVALTRAKYSCYCNWGHVGNAPYSAFAYLLHHQHSEHIDSVALALKIASLSDDDISKDLNTLAASSPEAIDIIQYQAQDQPPFAPDQVSPPELVAKKMSQALPKEWRITSYTALTSHHSGSSYYENPDYDQNSIDPEAVPANDLAPSIFTFPKGAKAGILMHSLFENIDFTDTNPDSFPPVIESFLEKHGFEPHWVSVLHNMLNNTLQGQLEDNTGLTLQQVSNSRRLVEMEFYLPLTRFQANALNRLLIEYLGVQYQPLSFETVTGMLKGFIDLTFEHEGKYYIVDYKSNHLGHCVQDYNHAALEHAMQDHHYDVQYLIYTVAVHRFLRNRIPEYDYSTHFGGVMYLFLRGIEAKSQDSNGIYRAKPSLEFMTELDALFAQPERATYAS